MINRNLALFCTV